MSWLIEIFRSCLSSPEGHTSLNTNLRKSVFYVTQDYNYVSDPLQFVFVGVSGCGKSTAIKNIFGLTQPEISNRLTIQVHQLQSQENKINFKVVDVPGLQHENSAEENARIIVDLKMYLCKSSPNSIPTILFLTASLNDNRFEGELSDFSQTLRALLYLKNHLFDDKYRNVVLLLTNSDRPDVAADLELRQSRYMVAFNKIFNAGAKFPVLLTVGNAPVLLPVIISAMASRTNNHHYSYFLNNYAELSINTILSNQTNEFKNFIGHQESKVLSTLVNEMNSNNIPKASILTEDIASNNSNIIPKKIEFHVIKTGSIKLNPDKFRGISKQTTINLFHPKSQIILANGDEMDIENCFVGTRILTFGCRVAVVTKRLCIIDNKTGTSIGIGHVLFNPVNDQCVTHSDRWYMSYNKESKGFKAIRNFDPLGTQDESAKFHYLEADYGYSTFVVDGYVHTSNYKQQG